MNLTEFLLALSVGLNLFLLYGVIKLEGLCGHAQENCLNAQKICLKAQDVAIERMDEKISAISATQN